MRTLLDQLSTLVVHRSLFLGGLWRFSCFLDVLSKQFWTGKNWSVLPLTRLVLKVLKSVIFRISPLALSKDEFAVLWSGKAVSQIPSCTPQWQASCLCPLCWVPSKTACMWCTVLQSAREQALCQYTPCLFGLWLCWERAYDTWAAFANAGWELDSVRLR